MNKTVIITGGTRGIGEACVRLFSEKMNVVFFYLKNDDIARRLELETGSVGYKVDVSDRESVRLAIGQIVERFGSIDVLVNNAGITRDKLLMQMKDNDIDDVLSINLKSAFLCSRAVTRTMLKQRSGRIINTSSIVGIAGEAGQTNYR